MKSILINSIAVVLGILAGSIVNMLIIKYGVLVITPPEGVDPSSTESLKENIHLFQAKHYIMPFLAHSLGTFCGAFVATLVAISHKMKFALSIGFLFFLGGIAAALMIPAPIGFIVTDLLLAYIPMAWLAGKLFLRFKN